MDSRTKKRIAQRDKRLAMNLASQMMLNSESETNDASMQVSVDQQQEIIEEPDILSPDPPDPVVAFSGYGDLAAHKRLEEKAKKEQDVAQSWAQNRLSSKHVGRGGPPGKQSNIHRQSLESANDFPSLSAVPRNPQTPEKFRPSSKSTKRPPKGASGAAYLSSGRTQKELKASPPPPVLYSAAPVRETIVAPETVETPEVDEAIFAPAPAAYDIDGVDEYSIVTPRIENNDENDYLYSISTEPEPEPEPVVDDEFRVPYTPSNDDVYHNDNGSPPVIHPYNPNDDDDDAQFSIPTDGNDDDKPQTTSDGFDMGIYDAW